MSLCEQYTNLKELLSGLQGNEWFKMNGSHRFPVYHGWKSSAQNNSDLHLLYIVDGYGEYIMHDQTRIELKKGSLVFVSHDVTHHAYIAPDSKLFINGLRFELFSGVEKITHSKIKPFYEFTFVGDYLYYNELTWRLHQAFHKGYDEISKRMCSAMLYQLLTHLHENKYTGKTAEQFNSRMETARRIMVDNIYNRKPISQIAMDFGISTRHFQKEFKLSFGITPMDYYQNIRMEMALETLKTTNISVTAVSELFGYSDGFIFSKQFKKFFGLSPSQVRK